MTGSEGTGRRADVREPRDRRLPPRSQRVPGGRGPLPGVLQLRVLPRGPAVPQPRPGALAADRQRAGPAGAVGAAGRPPRLRRHLRPDDPPPRRPLLRDHHQRRGRGHLPGQRRGPAGSVVGPGLDRPARDRPRPRLGRRRLLLVRRRRGAGGPDRPGDRQGPGRAAAGLVGDGAPAPGGAAPVPDRRLVVPHAGRGRHRARPRCVDRPRPLPARPLGTRAGQPGPLPPRHRPARPVHGPRRPGACGRRHLVDGAARHPPPRLVPGVPRARQGDLPDPGGVGGRVAAGRPGARAASGARGLAPPAAGARAGRLRRAVPGAGLDLPAQQAGGLLVTERTPRSADAVTRPATASTGPATPS